MQLAEGSPELQQCCMERVLGKLGEIVGEAR